MNKSKCLANFLIGTGSSETIKVLFQHLKFNTTLQYLHFPILHAKHEKMPDWIRDCFSVNATLLRINYSAPLGSFVFHSRDESSNHKYVFSAFLDHCLTLCYRLLEWFINRNNVCKELGAEEEDRNSIPPHLKSRDEMRKFLFELRRGFEEWRAMKLVVLGHGRIGKTTLLHALKGLLKQNPNKKVASITPSPLPMYSLLFRQWTRSSAQLELNAFNFSLHKVRSLYGISRDSSSTLSLISFFCPLR